MIKHNRAKRIVPVIAGLAMMGVVLGSLARCQTIRVDQADRLASYSDQPLGGVLSSHVVKGLVDYKGLSKESHRQLDIYLDGLARFGPLSTPEVFPDAADQLAYYLNAYNAIMLRKWLDGGAGENQKPRTVNKAWFFFDLWRVDGKWISLDSLEQTIIRPRYQDFRSHFALVCGAMSCPPLLAEPFVGSRLDEQLDGLGRQWLTESDGLDVREDGSVYMSSIFSWYAEDFEDAGGLAGMLTRYLAEDDPRREAALKAAREGRIQFMDYDWSINRQSPPGPPGDKANP